MPEETSDRLTDVGKRIQKAIYKLKQKPHVKVGFPAKSFAKQRKEDAVKMKLLKQFGFTKREISGLKLMDSAITNGELAMVHEFGSDDGRIPERSFIRSTHDKRHRAWFEATQKLKLKLLTLQINFPTALGLLGEIIKADIQSTIRRGGDPLVPNAPSTIAAKGSTHPLIDTAQLLNGVSYERVNAD